MVLPAVYFVMETISIFNTSKGDVTVVLARLVVASLAVIITCNLPNDQYSSRNSRGLNTSWVGRCMFFNSKTCTKSVYSPS